MPHGWISTAAAAAIIGVTPGRVRQLATAGTLRADKVGRDWIINLADARRVAAIQNDRGRPRSAAPKGVK